MRLHPALLLALISFMGCDAKTKSAQEAPAQPTVGTSRALESCGASADCAEGLRCIERRCATIERSVLGDQYAAAGRAAIATGNTAEAIAQYQKALAQYESEVLEPPPDVICEQGRALVGARQDPQMAEAAARVLHRCVLGVPPGSSHARMAHDELAKLMLLGLNAELLSRKEPADLYMTGQAAKPSMDKLSIKVQGDEKNKRKSYQAVLDALSAGEFKGQVGPCWEANWKATQKKVLEVSLPVSYRFILDEDDESRDRAVLSVEAPAGASEAATCVKAAVEAKLPEIAKSLREDTRWKATVSLRIGE
jgi:hypothetical protein